MADIREHGIQLANVVTGEETTVRVPAVGRLGTDDAYDLVLGRTRDALVLMLRAIREGYRVLRAHGIPITPKSHKVFQWLPEPLLLALMRRMVESNTTSIKIGHALGAPNEMKTIADELRGLADTASISTPAMDRLYSYLDPSTEPVPDGSSEIPVNRNALWIALGVLAASLWLVL